MEIKSERYGQALILHCKGELTDDSLEVFTKEVKRLLDGGAPDLVLSLEGVSFIDSDGLEYLLDLQEELMAAGGQFSLTNLEEAVAKIIEITRLDAEFEILPDVADAMKVV